jgi:hypothetical protein
MSTEQTRLELLDELKDETGDKLRRLRDAESVLKDRIDRLQSSIIDFEYIQRHIKALRRPEYQAPAIDLESIYNMIDQVNWLINNPGNIPVHMYERLKAVLVSLKSEIRSRQCQRDGKLAFVPSDDLDAANLAP